MHRDEGEHLLSRLSLYEQVLGADYERLPSAVQRFHRLNGHTVLHGWVEIGAPESTLARCLAICLGAPTCASSGPLCFELDSGRDTETWTRHFPSQSMTSRMRRVACQLEERLGAATLRFKLTVQDGKLSMELKKMRFFGVPCPGWLMPQIVAEETGTDTRLHFHVTATLPLAGAVAHYRGHLEVQ